MVEIKIMRCPQCQAESTQFGSFWVSGVHGTVPEPKPSNPLRSVIHGGRERYIIVIDALDEVGEAGRNPMVEMLARNAQQVVRSLAFQLSTRIPA